MKSTKKTIRLYILGPYTPVVESQVINWLEVLSKNAIETHCLSIIDEENQKVDQSVRFDIESRIQGKYYEYVRNSSTLARDIGCAIALYKLISKYKTDSNRVIVQCRNNVLGSAVIFLKWFPQVTFIFEARASGVIEYNDYLNKDSIEANLRCFKLRYYERLYVKNADRIICVSHKLKNYFKNQYNIKNESVFKVIPGVADADIFFNSDDIRRKIRSINSWDDRYVFLYSGGIDLPWQIADVVFTFFNKLYVRNSRSFFVVLTRQTNLAKDLFERYKIPPDSYYTEFVTPDKLNQFYNAADYGLLFRENRPTNNTASPTKFSEYMLSGLPILITEGIGDFSDFVRLNDCGYVLNVDDIKNYDVSFLFENKSCPEKREFIAKLGADNFAKQSYVKHWHELLTE